MIRIRPEKRFKPETRFEVAPLIDIIFILLIFFAVSSTVIINKGMKIQLPSAVSITSEKKGYILTIDRNQRLFLNQKYLPVESLQNNVAKIIQQDKEAQIILFADRHTPYDFLIRTLDNIRLGGCFDIVLEAEKAAGGNVPQRKAN